LTLGLALVLGEAAAVDPALLLVEGVDVGDLVVGSCGALLDSLADGAALVADGAALLTDEGLLKLNAGSSSFTTEFVHSPQGWNRYRSTPRSAAPATPTPTRLRERPAVEPDLPSRSLEPDIATSEPRRASTGH
jgi:hypothetical protein